MGLWSFVFAGDWGGRAACRGGGIADIVIGSGGGAQATVATFQGGTWANLKNFYAYTGYTGQVNVGTVDTTGAGTGRTQCGGHQR